MAAQVEGQPIGAMGERVARIEGAYEYLATKADIERLRAELKAGLSILEARLTWKLLLWTGVWAGVLTGIFKWG